MVVTVQGMVPFSLLCSMSVWCERTKLEVRCCVRNKGVNKISQNTNSVSLLSPSIMKKFALQTRVLILVHV